MWGWRIGTNEDRYFTQNVIVSLHPSFLRSLFVSLRWTWRIRSNRVYILFVFYQLKSLLLTNVAFARVMSYTVFECAEVAGRGQWLRVLFTESQRTRVSPNLSSRGICDQSQRSEQGASLEVSEFWTRTGSTRFVPSAYQIVFDNQILSGFKACVGCCFCIWR